MTKVRDLLGQKFGKLTCIKRLANTNKGLAVWLCKCDCGNETAVKSTSLISSNTESCGCIKRQSLIDRNSKHKLSITENGKKSRLYNIWCRMKQRCNDPKNTDYKDYGGRGIRVCDEWNNDFKAFHEWSLKNGYNENLTIDRREVDGNYEPANCKWTTLLIQARNKRNNHLITYNGQTKTLAEWSEITGIESSLIRYRIKNNWSIERSLTTKTA